MYRVVDRQPGCMGGEPHHDAQRARGNENRASRPGGVEAEHKIHDTRHPARGNSVFRAERHRHAGNEGRQEHCGRPVAGGRRP